MDVLAVSLFAICLVSFVDVKYLNWLNARKG